MGLWDKLTRDSHELDGFPTMALPPLLVEISSR
jgi:hypothetical protein